MHDGDYLFQIPDMHNLYCRFDGVGNEIGLVKVFDDNGVHRYSITFITPRYIKCPFEWNGAGFRYATAEEQAGFLRTLPSVFKEPWLSKGLNIEEEYYKYQSLYVVDIDSDTDNPSQIQFLAGSAKLHEQ
jgi:hypothetical protein